MSINDTELTFTRCSGCRSLVPASASRCRMCGELLSKEAESAEGSVEEQPNRSSSRVRQRTMSLSSDDAKAIVDRVKSASSMNLASSEKPADKPTEAFRLRPLDLAAKKSPLASVSKETSQWKSPLELSGTKEKGEGAKISPSNMSAGSAGTATSSPGLQVEAKPSTAEASAVPQSQSVAEGKRTSVDVAPKTAETQSGLSASTLAKGELSLRKKARRRKKKKVQDVTTATSAGTLHVAAREEPGLERKKENLEQPMRTQGDVSVQPNVKSNKEAPKSSAKSVEATAKPRELEEGGLFGWFVRYDEQGRGSATEIRTGRFFVSAEKLKDVDLVIEDETISTPHCVVRASVSDGLRVQDLLSEGGTFVRRRNEGRFYEYSDAVTLEHGDWLRFGDYEVLVCLVTFADAAAKKV
ncbi:MAG: FHA domain-containing protein [Deltaproteobacteria bacterium]|nr:FHA domain-containing protein [Deltaproteobacteria bacterium]